MLRPAQPEKNVINRALGKRTKAEITYREASMSQSSDISLSAASSAGGFIIKDKEDY